MVNSTAEGAGVPPGKLDLREAVNLANVLSGAQTITFNSTVFATAQTITLTAGELELSNTTGTETITGPAAGLTVSGGHQSRVFQVLPRTIPQASISGLAITGGVYNDGTLALSDYTVSGNAFAVGGGVENDGTLTMTDCTVSGNSALNSGGGVWNHGTLTLTDCTVSGNSAADGGGLYNDFESTAESDQLHGQRQRGLRERRRLIQRVQGLRPPIQPSEPDRHDRRRQHEPIRPERHRQRQRQRRERLIQPHRHRRRGWVERVRS